MESQKEDAMEKEARNPNKSAMKLLLLSAKVIPMVIAFLHLVNIILGYFVVDCQFLSYIGGMSLLSLAFFYICSYALKFCEYHRMFIHYSVLIDLINIYDEYVGIPLSNWNYFVGLLAVTAIMLFITLYLRFRCI